MIKRILKQSVKISIITAVLFIQAPVYSQTEWIEQEAEHFIVYYQEGVSGDFVAQAAQKAEEYYNSIVTNMGLVRYEGWLWAKRAKIYIFKNADEYRKKENQNAWSGGSTSILKKSIYTYYGVDGFLERVLPHELGHLIFREQVGLKGNVPLWLDEGTALSCEPESKDSAEKIRAMTKEKMYLSLDKLNLITENNVVFPDIFYSQSASLVKYLQKNFKNNEFAVFCQQLKTGKPVEKALDSAFNLEGMEGLEKGWLKYMEE